MNNIEIKRAEMQFDILHSDCRNCVLQELECLHYTTGECREVK